MFHGVCFMFVVMETEITASGVVINIFTYIVVTAISYGLLQHCIIGALKEFKKREEAEKALDDE